MNRIDILEKLYQDYDFALLMYKKVVKTPKTIFGIQEETNGVTYPCSENVLVI